MSDRIPVELVTQILILSRMDTLLSCRSVCKQWRSIIDEPIFSKRHLNHSILTNTNKILLFHNYYEYFFDVDFDSLHDRTSIKLSKKKAFPSGYDVLVGSCNGLICKRSVLNDDVVILNPYTRKHLIVPSILPPNIAGREGSGFGFDSVSDGYKIVRIVNVYQKGAQILIYNVRTRKVNVIQLPCVVRNEGIREIGYLVNGTLHWILDMYGGYPRNDVIMGLNLGNDEFKEIQHPNFRRRGVELLKMHISVLGKWLCIFAKNSDVGTDVWVMKEYGVKDSWTMLFTIPSDVLSYDSVTPLEFSGSGSEVLLEVDRERLVWYDIKRKNIRDIELKGWNDDQFYTILGMKSLAWVSGVGTNEKERQQKAKGQQDQKQKESDTSKVEKKTKKKKDDFLSVGFKLKL